MMSWERTLAPFKARENKEVAALVLADRNLQKMLAAWPMATLTCLDDPDGFVGLGWDAIWANVQVNETGLATLTGLQAMGVKKTLARALALRLVYPDGTIHEMALMVIRKQIKDALSA